MFRKIVGIPLLALTLLLGGCFGDKVNSYDLKMNEIEKRNTEETKPSISESESTGEPEPMTTKVENLSGKLTISTYFDEYMQRRAEAFMALYPDVEIELIWPADAEEETLEMYGRRIAVELMSGTATDLVDLSHLSAYKYAKSGLLVDLNEWMKQDPQFDREEYYYNIFEAMEVDGGLYAIPFAFNYDVLYVNKPMSAEMGIQLSSNEGLHYLRMLEIYEQAKEHMGASHSFRMMPGLVKDSFFKYEIMEYIDPEAAKASFNSEAFIRYLNTTNDMVDAGEEWDMNYVSSGNDAYMEQYMFSKFTLNAVDIHNLAIEYPNVQGPVPLMSSGGKYPFDLFLASYGISKHSQNKALAWEFLKFCIAEQEFTSDDADAALEMFRVYEGWIPINIQNFYNLFRIYGKNDIARLSAEGLAWKEGDPKQALEDALDQVHQWNMQRNQVAAEFELWSLVESDLELYYHYDLFTAEEIANMLQNKVRLYLLE